MDEAAVIGLAYLGRVQEAALAAIEASPPERKAEVATKMVAIVADAHCQMAAEIVLAPLRQPMRGAN